MKRLLPLLLIYIMAAVSSCGKLEDNGDFAGAWQLTSWQDKTADTLVADKTSRIYLYVSRELIRLQSLDEEQYYLCTFHRSADSLYLDHVFASPYDSIVAYDALSAYGVSPTGRFRVSTLTSDRLVLENEQNVLTYRKY